MSDIKYEPTREHWVPYQPWMRDVLADDARVSWVDGGGISEFRSLWPTPKDAPLDWLTDHDLRIHPNDCPERPAGEHPDEALAQTIADAFYEGDSYDAARAAREYIEAEREDGGCNIRRAERERKRRVKAEADLADMTRQRGKCATRADEWQARHAALREDAEEVVAYFEEHPTAGVRPRHVARRIKWNVLDRDDEWGQA